MKNEFPTKEAYVIVDTKKGRINNLFSVDSGYIPWIVHSFTDELSFARFFTSKDLAQELCDKFTKERFEFDGNTPLKPGRLKVMEIALVPVEQGG